MNTRNKQALMVYNPSSGKKVSHQDLTMIIKNLSEMGYRLTVYQPQGLNNIGNPIKNACQNKWEAIFIAGGDGTVNQTIQLIAEEEYRPAIGLFPFGTSNEFAKYIGMSSSTKALSIIKGGYTKPIDIGKFGNRYFANIAAAGWLSDITYKTSPFLKSYFGEWAYCYHFLKTFFFTKQLDTISVDVSPNDVFTGLSLFLIMNGNSVGPFENLIKNSTYNDGHFHLLTCEKINRLQLFFLLLATKFNFTDILSIIHHTKIKSGRFTIPDSLALNLDGEKAYINNLDFEVLPQHLHVFSLTTK